MLGSRPVRPCRKDGVARHAGSLATVPSTPHVWSFEKRGAEAGRPITTNLPVTEIAWSDSRNRDLNILVHRWGRWPAKDTEGPIGSGSWNCSQQRQMMCTNEKGAVYKSRLQ